uniref:Uncharacterized protein n=1 Tax=Rhizophora mucronata TaxID=61149 RepID=A0A2P2NS55_RHIMU
MNFFVYSCIRFGGDTSGWYFLASCL